MAWHTTALEGLITTSTSMKQKPHVWEGRLTTAVQELVGKLKPFAGQLGEKASWEAVVTAACMAGGPWDPCKVRRVCAVWCPLLLLTAVPKRAVWCPLLLLSAK